MPKKLANKYRMLYRIYTVKLKTTLCAKYLKYEVSYSKLFFLESVLPFFYLKFFFSNLLLLESQCDMGLKLSIWLPLKSWDTRGKTKATRMSSNAACRRMPHGQEPISKDTIFRKYSISLKTKNIYPE